MTAPLESDGVLLVGTYTRSLPHVKASGKGIHLLGFDSKTGAISDGPLLAATQNPTYLTTSSDSTRLYAVQELGEEDGATIDTFKFDLTNATLERLSSLPAMGGWPCHVSLDNDETRLFASNYLTGSFVTFPLGADGMPEEGALKIQHTGGSINPDRQKGPHVHQCVATPDGEHILVCDAGTDEIRRYRLSGSTVETEPNFTVKSTPGTLPRHLAFLPDGSGFLVVHELGAKIDAYRYSSALIEKTDEINTLPENWSGQRSGATIRVHPSGAFAYSSNRGHDSIFGLDLSQGLGQLKALGWWSTHGQAPRDFNIVADGRFLVAANQDSHNLTVYAIDQTSGELTVLSSDFNIGSPVSLLYLSRN